jgi:hypothetical protein
VFTPKKVRRIETATVHQRWAPIDPIVNLDFYQICNCGSRLLEDAKDFSGFLKTYIAKWAGTSGGQ